MEFCQSQGPGIMPQAYYNLSLKFIPFIIISIGHEKHCTHQSICWDLET